MRPSGATAARPATDVAANAAADAIPRLVDAGLDASLERFGDRTLLAAGKVNLISLEAVKQRFGPRWAMRQDHVMGFAERVVQRGVGLRGLYLRVSATDILLVQPDLGRLASQAACVRYLREILLHFLGDAELAGSGVMQVTRIASGAIDARELDPDALNLAESDEPEAEEAAPAKPKTPPATIAAEQAEPARPSVDRWSPFVAVDGRQLRVSATLEPVYELKGFTRIGFRLIRRVIVTRTGEELNATAMADLSAADRLRIDLATIARGLDRVRADGEGERQLSLIVPLSYASLSSLRGRSELVQPLREAGAQVSCGVICEICDIEGVPSGALYSAVALIKPFTLLVVGRLSEATPQVVGRLPGAGLRGISLRCPTGLGDPEFVAWAARTVRRAKRVSRSVMIYGVEGARRAGELSALGATHVSLAAGV